MDDNEVLARLLALTDAADDRQIEALDELVHDVKAGEAASINNAGVEAQIEFLLDSGVDEDQIVDCLTWTPADDEDNDDR
jgi:hypothetical protein